jgi:hypothetical protein
MPEARHKLRLLEEFDPKTLFENDVEHKGIQRSSKNLVNNENQL